MKKTIVVYLAGMGPSGGKERVVSNLMQEWVKQYDIYLMTKDTQSSFYHIPDEVKRISLNTPFLKSMRNMSGSRYVRAISSLFNMICSVFLLKKELKKIHYDYLYVTTPLNAYEAYHAMKNPERQLVVSEHASIDAFNAVYSKMKKKIYPKSYCISVPNRMDTEEYKEWGCHAVYIPHMITFGVHTRTAEPEKIVLNVGRLTADKQQKQLISIWNSIDADKRKDWKLWIVGSGEDEDELKEQIAQSSDESISLLPSTQEIDRIYSKASLFAFTSRCEGFGMVLLEAMAFGVPCISYDCPSGPRDVIADGENGYLIPDGDQEMFASALTKAMNLERDEYNHLVEGCYKTIYNWRTEKIIDLWNKVFL